MKAIDLCAGAGGLSVGLQRAGFRVWGVEHNPHAVLSYRANVGPCEERDARTFTPDFAADLVAGGVPCQPFSTGGKRAGLSSEDGTLYRDLLRVAVQARARAVLLENVRGLLTWRNDKGQTAIEVVKEEFREYGFQVVCSALLDAADFGVPQHRQRVFLVGFREALDASRFSWPRATHGPGLLPYVTVREALKLEGEYVPGGRLEGKKNWSGERRMHVDRPSTTITSSPSPDFLQLVGEAGLLDRPSTTIQGDPRVSRAGHHDRQQNGAVRMTPEQCAALQGFPPEFVFHGAKQAQHKQIGNAVPPALACAVAREIRRALEHADR